MTNIFTLEYAPQSEDFKINWLVESIIKLDMRDGILILPELFLSGYLDMKIVQEKNLESELSQLQEIASQHQLTIFGSLPIISEKKSFNKIVEINKNEVITGYSKIHLFGKDQSRFEKGTEQPKIHIVNGYKIIPIICLDIIDAELINKLVLENDVDIIAVCATVGMDFLVKISQARALEHQAIVVFSNRSGLENGIKYLGRSTVFMPKGEIVRNKVKDKLWFTKTEISDNDLKAAKKMRQDLLA